jgi:glycosyltransferase involved in cell wall biosynthesis
MRVALISFAFADYTIRLANAVAPRTDKVALLLPRSMDLAKLSAVDQRIDLYRFGSGCLSPRNPRYALGFGSALEHLRRFKPDVVHVQGGFDHWFAYAAPFLGMYTLVSTFHDVKMHVGSESPRAEFHRWWARRLSKEIIVHGERLREQMLSDYRMPGDRVHVVLHGAGDVEPFTRHMREDLQEDGNLVLFFGWIVEYKGLEYLLKAQPLIAKEVPGAKIVIAGKGDLKKYENLMTDRDAYVIHNEFISYEKGAELFQRSSVLVMPYIDGSESGITALGYGFKKPVVVTDVGSIPEAVENGKTGFVVPPRDPEALAEAIVRLLKDEKLRREMGQNGYRKLNEDYSWEKIAEKTIRVYERALNGRWSQGQ